MRLPATALAFAVLLGSTGADRALDDVDNFKHNVSLKDVTFTLYTRRHGNEGAHIIPGDKESVKKAGFLQGLPIKIAAHGFLSDGTDGVVQGLRKAFLSRSDCNFIAVDWSKYSKNILYEQAVLAVKPVGIHISNFLRFLREEVDFSLGSVHALGHSLGAHVVSFVSDRFPDEKVARITGTDPAGPLLENRPPSERLDSSDAHFVDVIHTTTFFPGTRYPCGTVDYYPNGGNGQPGCEKLDFTCNHNMAFRYFIRTVNTGKDYEAVGCESLRAAEEGNCSGQVGAMGIGATSAKPGIYYIKIAEVPKSGKPFIDSIDIPLDSNV